VRVERERCPFCHEPVRSDDTKAACDACMAWHHADCWAEHDGCAACDHSRPLAPAAPRRSREAAATSRAPERLDPASEHGAPCQLRGCEAVIPVGEVLCRRHRLKQARGLRLLALLALGLAVVLLARGADWVGPLVLLGVLLGVLGQRSRERARRLPPASEA